jgi:hypothetical protein
MNSINIRSIALFVLLAAHGTAAAQTGMYRGFPTAQNAYYNGYYGAAPSYAYAAAPQAAYYTPGYQRGYPVMQPVAVAPSSQAARVAYYAPPAVAYYAPASPGYAISPAGGATSGAEAFPYYGQQQRLNYVPPTYYYQTRMVPVPVTYYRPVTVYQPGTAVPTTCQKACTGTQCQAQRSRLFSWFGSGCNSGATTCNYGATTCNYGSCGAAPAAACGTVPYYSTVPGVTAPATIVPTAPSRGFNNILTPSTTIPPPGTGTIGPGTTTPFISPGATVPGSTPAIRSTVPGTTIPPRPSTFPAPTSGGLGTGSSSTAPDFIGSSFRSSFDKSTDAKPQKELQLSRPTITEPGMKPRISETPSTLRPVHDPEAAQRTKPGSRAPALINPDDKTARTRANQPLGAATYGVVAARWPEKTQEVNYKVQTASAETPVAKTPAAVDLKLDDSGWKSAR